MKCIASVGRMRGSAIPCLRPGRYWYAREKLWILCDRCESMLNVYADQGELVLQLTEEEALVFSIMLR